MRFSDSIIYDIIIPKPNKFANSDSSPFNSNDSHSNDTSSPNDQILSHYDLFQNSSNTNPLSNTTSPFKQNFKAPDNNHYSDRTRHPSQNQSTPPYAKTTTQKGLSSFHTIIQSLCYSFKLSDLLQLVKQMKRKTSLNKLNYQPGFLI